MNQEIITIAQNIGNFYYEKNNKNYPKTVDELLRLNITKIEMRPTDWDILSSNEISITTSRPGILIGPKGKNIAELEKYICLKMNKNITILVIEERDSLIDYLMPMNEEADFDSDF